MTRTKIINLVVIFCLAVFSFTPSQAADDNQAVDPGILAQQLLERLTPEERIGQLLLVTFKGPEAAPGTADSNQIYDLIYNYHVGGVILLSGNDNFLGGDQTIPILQSLSDQLQRNEYDSSLNSQNLPGSDLTFRPAYIPLLIGVSQNGDGYPYDQILNGLTELPNQMALGATWDPNLARKVGNVLGNELSILGINLLFGPSLDVLEAPFSESGGDLGVRSFGGDPFWVGEMGRAYIEGVHQGSTNKVLVVAKNFPGFGSSDRLPEEEVATVRKNLEQLKQFELAPFFAVTGDATSTEGTTDALLTANLRIQGFQDNFRATTKPISFDPQALSKLMNLPALQTWRDNGGILISDNLGSRAVRRFYDPSGLTFNARSVAIDAFLAGNDLLYLGDFVSNDDPDSYSTIIRTINTFALRYREDSAFAQRVDEAVIRILALKYRLYDGEFVFTKTLPKTGSVSLLGKQNQVTFDVASHAATLISPPLQELDTAIPSVRDQIVFITDTRTYQQCTRCFQTQVLEVNALEQAVVRFYSPLAGGKVIPANLSSFALSDLQDLLDAGVGQKEIEGYLRQAQWIVISILNRTSTSGISSTLQQFLNERLDLIQGKNVIVFAFNAPYFLDATDVSKLTAYYGIYSRSPEFIEVAARILFQEVIPQGDLPVSVSGVSYDVNDATYPDPNQIIPLFLDMEIPAVDLTTPTPDPMTAITTFNLADLVPLRTGTILDHNGHIVPDGTIVRFILTRSSEPTSIQQVESETYQGVSRAVMQINTTGNIDIRVESQDAKNSDVLQLIIPVEKPTETLAISPTSTPSDSPTPTATTTISPTATPAPTPMPIPEVRASFGDWLGSLFTSIFVASICYMLGIAVRQAKIALRGGILAVIGGSLAYIYLALKLPGSVNFLEVNGFWGIVFVTFTGAIIGILGAIGWNYTEQYQK